MDIIEMSEWIEWNGGECPVGESEVVDIRLDSGHLVIAQRAGSKYWEHPKMYGQKIVAYRLSKANGDKDE